MGQLKLFGRRKHEEASAVTAVPALPGSDLLPAAGQAASLMSLNPGDGEGGINEIFAFLQADYESRGYNDALINPDESYSTDNAVLLHHDLMILIDKSVTHYEGLLKEIDFHIGSRSRAGLVDLVEALRIRKEIVTDHLARVRQIREEAVGGTGVTQRIALSYRRGFMRGLSAITQSRVFSKRG